MNSFPSILASFVIFSFFLCDTPVFSQDKKSDSKKQEGKKEDEQTTVRGKIVNPRKEKLKFDVRELKVKMIEQVKLEPFPFPEDWQTRSIESRQEWVKKFQASDEGKKLIAKRQKQFDARKQIDIEIEDDGAFVVFDVPQGRYGISGRLDKEVDGKTYAFEVFGQIDVGDVNEVQLKDLAIVITRLFSLGEQAPDFSAAQMGGAEKIQLKDYKGKFVLVCFWSANSQPSVNDIKSLLPIYKSLKTISEDIEFLNICLDEDHKAAKKIVADNKIPWEQGVVKGWAAPAVEAFGVRSIPSYWLIDKSGKIAVTNAVFFRFFRQGTNIEKVITSAMAGKDLMKTLEAAEKKAQENANKK